MSRNPHAEEHKKRCEEHLGTPSVQAATILEIRAKKICIMHEEIEWVAAVTRSNEPLCIESNFIISGQKYGAHRHYNRREKLWHPELLLFNRTVNETVGFNEALYLSVFSQSDRVIALLPGELARQHQLKRTKKADKAAGREQFKGQIDRIYQQLDFKTAAEKSDKPDFTAQNRQLTVMSTDCRKLDKLIEELESYVNNLKKAKQTPNKRTLDKKLSPVHSKVQSLNSKIEAFTKSRPTKHTDHSEFKKLMDALEEQFLKYKARFEIIKQDCENIRDKSSPTVVQEPLEEESLEEEQLTRSDSEDTGTKTPPPAADAGPTSVISYLWRHNPYDPKTARDTLVASMDSSTRNRYAIARSE